MKYIRIIFLFGICSILHFTASAQNKGFDMAHFTIPNGWAEERTEGHVSYSRMDNGNWGQIIVYKSTTSTGSVDTDFDNDWKELVAVNKEISIPKKIAPRSTDGWFVLSGSGTWQYNLLTVTSVLTVYSNGRVCISLLCNTTDTTYLKDYQVLLASLVLQAKDEHQHSDAIESPPNGGSSAVANRNSIVGIWIVNEAETRGFTNGHRMYSGGYIRKEYQIKDDGTYIFREKDWLANNEAIYFVYETGTWAMNGNKLTITPKKGKASWWYKDKVTNDVSKWGRYQKAASYKIQAADYTVEVKVDPNYSNAVIFNCNKATERDGGQFNSPPYRFVYVQRKEPLIDNPPGLTF